MFYVYVLYSLKDKKRYIGLTENIKNRIQQHNSGFVRSTVNRRPLVLIYIETAPAKPEAMARERFLKTGKGREYLSSVIKDNSPLQFP